ncbi:CobW family GTP-binding protein [Paenirhodobacter sp.]|uniref:CobW family GTP-binding protein n=1 Tax=Paenirhodobacter sp. TaxID=1965326 RepID=UPI003B3E0508
MTPVILLTGFLGSGKTTLLQRLLTDPSMARAAVLINEYGEVGLDHHLLDRIDETVMLMKSGCICCTVRGEIAEALLNLESLRVTGRVDFDRVVMETTGLADPWPVLQTLRAHPVLRSHFASGGVLTTVDAVNAAGQLDHRAEALRQIAAADRIVLTKTDLAASGAVFNLRRRLGRINPSAEVCDGAEPVARLIGGLAPGFLPLPPDACDGQHHHDHDFGVQTFSMVFDRPLDWTAFGIWLGLLLHRYGDRIFRVKGILDVEGEERPVAIHGVQHLIHAPVHMTHWPEGPRVSRLVFILEGLDPTLVRRSFAAFLRLPEPVA